MSKVFSRFFLFLLALIIVGSFSAEAAKEKGKGKGKGKKDLPDQTAGDPSGTNVAGGKKDMTPGKFFADQPSFYCAPFRWYIEGDANYNCKGTMTFRKKGNEKWEEAYPLMRVIFPPPGTELDKKVRNWWKNKPYPNVIAGSIFNLAPATSYEVKISIEDPDGGKSEKSVTVTTRDWPKAGGNEKRVTPSSIKGNLSGSAGTRIVLSPGQYSGFKFKGNGTAQAPIIIEGSSAKDVVVNGSIEVSGSYIWIRNLTVKSDKTCIRSTKGPFIIVSGCNVTLTGTGHGIFLEDCSGSIVMDNNVKGPCTWPRGDKGIESQHGIQFVGNDVIVINNRVSGFADGISGDNYVEHNNLEVAYNDVSECTDDGIQLEFTTQNARCYRNRWTNVFNVISAAPNWGGPCYIVQNEMYNVHWPLKVMRAGAGTLIFNNTSYAWKDGWNVSSQERWFNVKLRNNILIGQERKAFECTVGNYFVDVDYNGHGVVSNQASFGKWEGTNYASLPEMQKAGYFKNSVAAMPDVWVKAPPLQTEANVMTVEPSSIDYSLKAGANVIDKGEPIPNILGEWSGKAPDLGAREFGSKPRVFGPRPQVK